MDLLSEQIYASSMYYLKLISSNIYYIIYNILLLLTILTLEIDLANFNGFNLVTKKNIL